MLRIGKKQLIINAESDFPLVVAGKPSTSGSKASFEGVIDDASGVETGIVYDSANGISGTINSASTSDLFKIRGFGQLYRPTLLRAVKVVPYAGYKKTTSVKFTGSTFITGAEVGFRITMRSNKLQTEYVTFFNDGKTYQYRTLQIKANDTTATIASNFAAMINNSEMSSYVANPLFKLVATVFGSTVIVQSPASDIDFIIETYDVTTARYNGTAVGIAGVTISTSTTVGEEGFYKLGTTPTTGAGSSTLASGTVNTFTATLTGADTAMIAGTIFGFTVNSKTYYNYIISKSGSILTLANPLPITIPAATPYLINTDAGTTGNVTYGTTGYNEGTNNYDFLRTQVFETEANIYPYSNLANAESRQVPLSKTSLYTSYIISQKVERFEHSSTLNSQSIGYFDYELFFNSATCPNHISAIDTWLETNAAVASTNTINYGSNEANRTPFLVAAGTAGYSGTPYVV